MMANGLTLAIGFFRYVSSSKWVGLAKPHNSSRIGYRSINSTGAAMVKGTVVSSLVVGGFAPQAVLAQMKAGVGGKHEYGAVRKQSRSNSSRPLPSCQSQASWLHRL